jgi:hypothetical protein
LFIDGGLGSERPIATFATRATSIGHAELGASAPRFHH